MKKHKYKFNMHCPDCWDSCMRAVNRRKPVASRLLMSKTSRDKYIKLLEVHKRINKTGKLPMLDYITKADLEEYLEVLKARRERLHDSKQFKKGDRYSLGRNSELLGTILDVKVLLGQKV